MVAPWTFGTWPNSGPDDLAILLSSLAADSTVGLEFPHACGKSVGCLVEERKQVVLAAVLLPDVDGDNYGGEQRRANDTHPQLVRFCSSLAREQRRQFRNSVGLFFEETRPHLRNAHGQLHPLEEPLRIASIEAAQGVADNHAEALGKRFVVGSRLETIER